MQGLGYKEVVDYLDGKYTKEEMIEKIKGDEQKSKFETTKKTKEKKVKTYDLSDI